MVSCLTSDHKVGGSISCQAKTTLLNSSLSTLQAAVVKISESEA